MPLVPSHQCPADTLQACSQSTMSPLLTQPWLAAGHGTASRSLSSTPDLCLRVAVHHPCTHGRPAPFPRRSHWKCSVELGGTAPARCLEAASSQRPTRCQAGSAAVPDPLSHPESPSVCPTPAAPLGAEPTGRCGHMLCRPPWVRTRSGLLLPSCVQPQSWGLGWRAPGRGVPTELPCTERREGERKEWKHRGPAHKAGILLRNPIRSVRSQRVPVLPTGTL